MPFLRQPYYYIQSRRENQPFLCGKAFFVNVPRKESAVRRQIIRETYEHAKANHDSHVVFVDGGQFYGSTDREAYESGRRR